MHIYIGESSQERHSHLCRQRNRSMLFPMLTCERRCAKPINPIVIGLVPGQRREQRIECRSTDKIAILL